MLKNTKSSKDGNKLENTLKSKDKKGQLNGWFGLMILTGIVLTIVVITSVIGSQALFSIARSSGDAVAQTGVVVGQNGTTVTGNISRLADAGILALNSQNGLIGIVVALTVVLGVLLTLLFNRFISGFR